nr:syncytin-2-like [Aotus nancymaae]
METRQESDQVPLIHPGKAQYSQGEYGTLRIIWFSRTGHEDADSCRPSDRSLPWNPCRLRRYIRHQPAIPSNSISGATNGTYSLPFPVQLHHINCINVTCVSKPPRNNSFDLDVGSVWLACNCSNHTNVSQEIFSPPGQVFVCGNNLAYTYLPNNWTGSCLPAFLLPEASVLPGDTAVPIPSFDFLAGRRKRALQFFPFLAALGVTAGVGTGTAGLSYSLRSYQALSEQLINDVGVLSGTINIIQNQIHSLAEVVLQNRRGLDLLTAEKGGICLALGEKCCFYVNQSGIVSDKIKALQEDLARRRKALADNPLWGGWNGLLPYVLPLAHCLASFSSFLLGRSYLIKPWHLLEHRSRL